MKNFYILLLCLLPMLGMAQDQPFKVGVSVGHILYDNENPYTNYDVNIVAGSGDWFAGIGVYTDNQLNGWGWPRLTLGHYIHPTITIQGTLGKVDTQTNTYTNYGIDLGWQAYGSLHFTVGVETKRGPRIGIMILNL